MVLLYLSFWGRPYVKGVSLKIDFQYLNLNLGQAFHLYFVVIIFSFLVSVASVRAGFGPASAGVCVQSEAPRDLIFFKLKCFYYVLDKNLFSGLLSLCLIACCFGCAYFKRGNPIQVSHGPPGSRANWGWRKALLFYTSFIFFMYSLSRFAGHLFFLSAFNGSQVVDLKATLLFPLAVMAIYLFSCYGFLLSIVGFCFWAIERLSRGGVCGRRSV